jgi:hypothetical protein
VLDVLDPLDEPEELDDEEEEPDPSEEDPFEEPEEDESEEDSDLPALTVLVVDVLRESVR